MAISAFDLFSIGIGPSSSHTVGPMRAANQFVQALQNDGLLDSVGRIKSELYGSLGATGKGHGSDKAVLLGFEGELPESIDTTTVEARLEKMRGSRQICLLNSRQIAFNEKNDLIMHRRQTLPLHSNGMTFRAYNAAKTVLHEASYYSIGGGFIVDEQGAHSDRIVEDDTRLPFPFRSAAELLVLCSRHSMSISDIMLENETAWRSEDEVRHSLLNIWHIMRRCVANGCHNEGILPGGMNIRRRAMALYNKLNSQPNITYKDPLTSLDWVNLWALAVNEENAAGGRVVTAPTNGAAGIIPAVMHYYLHFCPAADDDGIVQFLLTAAAIGILYKENASISGAEVGCQGEVGSACSMAAGALTEVLGGTPEQVENAAEIGMEHNLGLTCDPVGGLVQIPCIERNAMAAVKAINAARIAMRGDGQHFISLDKVIKTMGETGADMKKKYKETARGGLAVNIIEC
ncbi:MAG: L-serine ammonia-lyase [Gammaproteobacteria bacterium]|nr:L-serine ammonia-lyase [Gammaproteobacteria bacterium]